MDDKRLLGYTLNQIFCLSKSNKLQAINMLIDSITDDAVYDALAEREADREY